MPYKVVRREGRFCVVKSDSGQNLKCYRRLSTARRLMRALYANVEDAERAFHHSVGEMYKSLTGVPIGYGNSEQRAAIAQLTQRALQSDVDSWPDELFDHARNALETMSRADSANDELRAYGFRAWADNDIRAVSVPHCVPKPIDKVDDWRSLRVLAVPFNVADSYNTYFDKSTEFAIAENVKIPVYDSHGLKGSRLDARPIGHVQSWERTEDGLWANVKLDDTDSRSRKFAEHAAQCELSASIGMLRAGMYPQPPAETDGVFEKPTLLEQAPIVELSLILPGEIKASNPYAAGGFEFNRSRGNDMCQDCQQSADDLRAQVEELRAQMEAMKKERDEAMRAAAEQRAALRAREASQRMMHYNLPQSVLDEFINVYNAVAEGDQDRLISVVGKMLDHIRAQAPAPSTDANPSLRVDSVRSMLTRQIMPGESDSANNKSLPPDSQKQVEDDIQWIRRQFAALRNGAKGE